ncbi:response regulator [Candidatus Kaiserbacteria bacterium]|nr:response regulator [Candidatus Kaiserbacteria bacterium]MCB9811375.1 response regulator [Candidatus Nomurabacteria bacterium]
MSTEANKTILIADDEPDLREALKVSLEQAGYTVVAAADGEEALAHYNAHVPDLVILDLNMPKLNGMEVLKQIRAGEVDGAPKVPICVLTAYDDINTVSEVTVMGGFQTDFLPKADHSLRQIVEHVNEHFAS